MTNKPLPKRLPAFAIERLMMHPLALTLPAAAFGMLCRLIFHFIASECRPIPPEGENLRSIMRAHKSTWAIHRLDIMAVFRELEPELIRDQMEYKRKRAQVLAMGEKEEPHNDSIHSQNEVPDQNQPTPCRSQPPNERQLRRRRDLFPIPETAGRDTPTRRAALRLKKPKTRFQKNSKTPS